MLKQALAVAAFLISLGLSAQGDFQPIQKNNGFSKGLDDANISVNLNTQVGTSFNNSYWFTQSISPNIEFNVTKKFSLVFGVGFAFTQLYNMPIYNNENSLILANGTSTSIYTYGAGLYQVNPKLQLYSAILLENATNKFEINPNAIQNQYKDISLGINYQINRHMTINAQMQYTDRPYSNYFGNSPTYGFGSQHNGFSPFY